MLSMDPNALASDGKILTEATESAQGIRSNSNMTDRLLWGHSSEGGSRAGLSSEEEDLRGSARVGLWPTFSNAELNLHGAVMEGGSGQSSGGELLAMDVPNGGLLDLFRFSPNRFEEQASGGSTGGLAGIGTSATSGPPGIKIIPMLFLSERYDSNVFFSPAIAGVKRDDYVTSVSPQLYVRDNARIVTTTLQLGAVGERYTNNPGLSYVGYNASLNLGLNELIGRVASGATLYVFDNVSYTPTPPAFLGAGLQSQVVGEGAGQDVSYVDSYVRGVQLSRVNTLTNSSTVAGSIPWTASTNLQASYTYSFVKFGTPVISQSNSGFRPVVLSSATHSVTIGPQVKVTGQDTLTVGYGYFLSSYSGGEGSYDSHGVTATWQRLISPSLILRVYVAGSMVKQDFGVALGATNPGVTTETRTNYVPTGGLSLSWSSRSTTVSANYSTGIYPSYQTSQGPLYSQVVGITGNHKVTDNFGGLATGNYARNESVGRNGGNGIFFDSYSTTLGLYYRLSSWAVATLTNGYGYFRGNYSGVAISQFHRSEVIFGLTTYWQ